MLAPICAPGCGRNFRRYFTKPKQQEIAMVQTTSCSAGACLGRMDSFRDRIPYSPLTGKNTGKILHLLLIVAFFLILAS
jgi:hypothetical protein